MYHVRSLNPKKILEGNFKSMNLTEKYVVLLNEEELLLHDVNNLHRVCAYNINKEWGDVSILCNHD